LDAKAALQGVIIASDFATFGSTPGLRRRFVVSLRHCRRRTGEWIEENTHRANDTAISIAMLETAFDRHIELLGATGALDLIESAFRRRAETFRR
jgi:hypothetical protein